MDEEKDNKEIVSQIIEDADGKFNVSVSVDGIFDRKRRRSIESKTETKIKVPRRTPNIPIEVSGLTRSAVESAIIEIEKSIAQRKRRPTHFLSIPINDKSIIDRFNQFKNEVSANAGNKIDEYFQKACKLHITLGVLSLFANDNKTLALQTLEECREIIDRIKDRFNCPGDLRIKICGVKCMNKKPAKCKVLYGIVESEILQTIANEIVNHFVSKGLIADDKSEVKLHVTVMNIVFVTRITKTRSKKINAISIMDKYSNYEFGEQKISEIHLSRFERTSEFAYYEPEAIIDLFEDSPSAVPRSDDNRRKSFAFGGG